eukprot:1012720-Rhodomonas_salina.4
MEGMSMSPLYHAFGSAAHAFPEAAAPRTGSGGTSNCGCFKLTCSVTRNSNGRRDPYRTTHTGACSSTGSSHSCDHTVVHCHCCKLPEHWHKNHMRRRRKQASRHRLHVRGGGGQPPSTSTVPEPSW